MSRLQGRATLLSLARARRWLEQGDLEAVEGWAAENQLGLDDDYSYHREAYYLMLARLYIARGTMADQALYLLERMVKRAEASQRHGSLIRAVILQAVAFQVCDDSQKAVESLARALSLAEAEQPIRVFIDEGHLIARLLEKILDGQRKGQLVRPVSPDYTQNGDKVRFQPFEKAQFMTL